MNINGKTRKDLIKAYRKKVENGKCAGRWELLAYAFLRDVPYINLERITNEDKFPDDGALTFIQTLAMWVAGDIICTAYGKSKWSMHNEFREAEWALEHPPTLLRKFKTMFVDKDGHLAEIREKKKELSDVIMQIETEIHEWMKEKYKKEEQKVA